MLEEEVKTRRLAEENLSALSASLMRIQDEERRRVARDLHDTTGQTLTALKLILSRLQDSIVPAETTSQLFGEINTLADQALQEIRTTSYLLHPPLLDEAGFAAAATCLSMDSTGAVTFKSSFKLASPLECRTPLKLPYSESCRKV